MGAKKLCSWSRKRRRRDLDRLKEIVAGADRVCRKCGRAANEKKYLCKPETLSG